MEINDLIPRPVIRAELVEALRVGSVLLYGPRRVGKSTLLDLLGAEPPSRWICLRIDLEGSLEQPVEGLAELLRSHLVQAGLIGASALAERIEGVQAAGVGVTLREGLQRSPWAQMEDDLLRVVGAMEADLLVIALDELPWWLDAVAERDEPATARGALASLRRMRQRRGLAGRLRVVLTGSIGLAGQASELGASAELNDLTTIVMPPMSVEEGATLFEAELTARSLPCCPEAARCATTLAGGSPYWIKRLAAACGRAGALDVGAVEVASEALLAPALRKQFTDEGREHFRRRHTRVMPALLAMLEAVSGADRGNPRQAALNAGLSVQPELTMGETRECLYLLMDGFYLCEGPQDTLDWVNPLFRRWWLRYGGP